MSATILDLLAQRGLKAVKISEQHGGEYVSPCPKCGGFDRFHIWPLRNPNIMRGGTWWCNCCERGGGVDSFLQAFGEPQVGTVVGDSVWSFLKSFPLVDFAEASKEKLREIILLQQKYLEIYSDKNVRLTAKNVRLTAAKAEALATAEAYAEIAAEIENAGDERLRRVILALENLQESTVSAIFNAHITEECRRGILNNPKRLTAMVAYNTSLFAGSWPACSNDDSTPCPICGGSGHIGDCEGD